MNRVGRYLLRKIKAWQKCWGIRSRFATAKPLSNPILLVGHEMKMTGAAMLLIHLANALQKKGYTVVLLINAGTTMDPAAVSCLSKGILIFQAHASSTVSHELFSILTRCGCKQCIANTVVTGLFADELRAFGFNVVWLIHEMVGSCHILHAEPLVDKILQTAKITIFPDETVKESFLELKQKKERSEIAIVPQGVYKKLRQPSLSHDVIRKRMFQRFNIPEHAVLLTGAGSVNFGKGVDLLVPVLSTLMERESQTSTEYHVLWMGSVPEDDSYVIWLKQQIKAAGINGRWHWSGFIADDEVYAELLSATDVFVLPSREDSYPSAMLEAQHMCIPTLAFSGSGGGANMALRQHGQVAKAGNIPEFCSQIELLASKPTDLMRKIMLCAERLKSEDQFSDYVDHILRLFPDQE